MELLQSVEVTNGCGGKRVPESEKSRRAGIRVEWVLLLDLLPQMAQERTKGTSEKGQKVTVWGRCYRHSSDSFIIWIFCKMVIRRCQAPPTLTFLRLKWKYFI